MNNELPTMNFYFSYFGVAPNTPSPHHFCIKFYRSRPKAENYLKVIFMKEKQPPNDELMAATGALLASMSDASSEHPLLHQVGIKVGPWQEVRPDLIPLVEAALEKQKGENHEE